MKTETAAAPARMRHTRRLNQLIKLLWLVCGATYPLSGNLQGAITDGLVVYLNFDETLDGQAGTAVNGRLLTGTARYTKGVFGHAAQFRNSFDAQSLNDWAVALDGIEATYTNSFSVALWFSMGSTRQRLIGNKSDPSSRGWTIGATWLAGNLDFVSQGQAVRTQYFYDVFDGRWHHLVVVFDRAANEVISYLDGIVSGPPLSIGRTGAESLRATRTVIGAGAQPGNGDVDDCAIWNRALTPDEATRVFGASLLGLSLAQADQPAAYFKDTRPAPNATQVPANPNISTAIHTAAGPINQTSIRMFFDGELVQPSIEQAGADTVLRYAPPKPLGSFTEHSVRVEASDLGTSTAKLVHDWHFRVANYVTVPESYAKPPGAGAGAGFRVRTVWATEANTMTTSLPPKLDRVRAQLDGKLINPKTGQPYKNGAKPGPNPDGSWDVESVIYFADETGPNWTWKLGAFSLFPGLPAGPASSKESFAAEALFHLELKAGHYRFGVNQDDCYEVRVGNPPQGLFTSLPLAGHDDPSGGGETFFDFHVPVDGVYSFELLFGEGWGGGHVALFSVDRLNGKYILINDPMSPDAIKSYRELPNHIQPPYVREARPAPGALDARADTAISIDIVDGTTALDPASVQMQFDGQPVAPQLAKVGNVTTLTHQPASSLAHASAHTIALVFGDGARSLTHTWQFETTPNTLDPLVTGQWDFDAGALRATVGRPLEFLGGPQGTTAAVTKFGSASDFGIEKINNEEAKVMKFYGGPESSLYGNSFGYLMAHGAAPNGSGAKVNSWTLIMDLLVPNQAGETFLSFAQTDSALNQNVGDLFARWTYRRLQGEMLGSLGVDFLQFAGTTYLRQGQWHRVAFAVDAQRRRIGKFVDGLRAGVESLSEGLDGRHALRSQLVLFADAWWGSQEGYVNSIQFRNYTMTDAEVAALGGPSAVGIPLPAPSPRLAILEAGNSITLSWPAELTDFVLERNDRLESANWTPVVGVSGNTAVLQAEAGTAFFRLRK